MTMFCGTNIILENIPLISMHMRNIYIILLVPHNIVVDMNNDMVISETCMTIK